MSPMPTRFSCVTWNIHGGVGRDGCERLDRVAAALSEIDADVVALQEVDCRAVHSGGGDKLQWLAQQCGYRPVAGPARHESGGYFGNAILTRLPVAAVQRIDISVRGREPRVLLQAELRHRGWLVQVIVTHFGLSFRERARQVQTLLQLAAAHDDVPLVVAGDFNEWRPRAATTARLEAALGRAPAVRSFPARWPLLKLDRVWARAPATVVSMRALNSGVAANASDHLPVEAQIVVGVG